MLLLNFRRVVRGLTGEEAEEEDGGKYRLNSIPNPQFIHGDHYKGAGKKTLSWCVCWGWRAGDEA